MLDDSTGNLFQAGRECIRAYLSVAANQLFEWKDAEGNNGISYVFRVINYLLSPSAPEMAAGMIAQLISVVLKRVGANVAPHLEAILTAVLLRYQTSDTATVKQSLIMVFAHLIHYCLPDLLLFLKSREGPAGYPTALHYVMCEWCERQQQFIGSYDRQVSTLAICKLLEFAVSSNDAALLSISVKVTQGLSIIMIEGLKTSY